MAGSNLLILDSREGLVSPSAPSTCTEKFRADSSASSVQYKESKESEDLRDIGHFMLFMLYSTYEPDHNRGAAVERSWQEELHLSIGLQNMIKRLMQLSEPYSSSLQFMHEPQSLANARDCPSDKKGDL